jgi:hypothetical protein
MTTYKVRRLDIDGEFVLLEILMHPVYQYHGSRKRAETKGQVVDADYRRKKWQLAACSLMVTPRSPQFSGPGQVCARPTLNVIFMLAEGVQLNDSCSDE